MDNACNVVINVSLNGHSYNHFLLRIHEMLKYSDYKKWQGLPKIKGRISALSSQAKTTTIESLTKYGTCAAKKLGISGYMVNGLGGLWFTKYRI